MAFLGMRGTGDWVTDQRPKSWREVILQQYPNGSAPLTAILSKMSSEATTDPEFNWWTKSLPSQRAVVTGVYTNTTLATAYVSGGVKGTLVYLKMGAADNSQFRVGHQVLMRKDTDLTLDVVGKVTVVVSNGVSSYIGVSLLESDDNSIFGYLVGCNAVLIIGNINAEGAGMPDAVANDASKWYNYTQIFRTPLEMTRTALKTKLRTGDQYKEAKREALETHSIEMEKAFLFGISTESIGSNGKPERTTLGLIPAIKGGYTGNGGAAGVVSNYALDISSASLTWLQGGKKWLNNQLEILFRYGSGEKLALCGSGALLAINALVENNALFSISAATTDYGIKVTKWVTVFGTINIMTHPLFSFEPTTRTSMVIFEPKDLKFRYIDDTMFKSDTQVKEGGWTNHDGIKEEYLTEGGLEYHNPMGWGYLYGFGQNNTM